MKVAGNVESRFSSHGIETSIVRTKELERTARIDAEYFEHRFQHTAGLIERSGPRSVASLVRVSDGNHFTITDEFVDEGIPYYRGQDVAGKFFIEYTSPNFVSETAYNRPYMKRSHLRKGDVLLSIVGTIGEISLVSTDVPATCSCKLAILRPHSIAPETLAVFLRSKHGRNQIDRLTRGAVQKGLLLEDMDQIWVPSFSPQFQKAVAATVTLAKAKEGLSIENQNDAERELLAALGLAMWNPARPASYAASFAEVVTSRRLDAEFYAPKIQQLVRQLSKAGGAVGTVARPRRERFIANVQETFDYIEIGNVQTDGTATSTRLIAENAPSRATWHVHVDDVITSMVRPVRRLSALITAAQDGFVCSSGFVVLEPISVAPEVLFTFIRLPVICELMDLYASASMYPAISEGDVLGLPFPPIEKELSDLICNAVQASRAIRQQADDLLQRATTAVENYVEIGEGVALQQLKEAAT